jgi:hypothetical protein
MGVGPAYAIPVALRNAGLTLKDIDVFEINEVRSPSLQSFSNLNFTLRSIILLSTSPSLIHFFILPISLTFLILSLSPVSFTSPHALPIMYHSLPPSLDFLSPLSFSYLLFRLLPWSPPGLRISVPLLCASPWHPDRKSQSLWGSDSYGASSRLLR